MTLGVTGVVWLPRTATVNSASLLAGAGPTPLAAAAGAWESVALAYTDASITVGRVMAVLAAGWEGEAANAAQARLGGFLAWTQGAAATATQVSLLAAGEAAAYTTAAVTIPNPAAIVAVKAAKATAYSTGGALNGSAEALEAADRALDIQAAIVMEAYEAATTPLAAHISFDRPPKIVNDGAVDSQGRPIDSSRSYSETSIFGFSTTTSPAQAAMAAVGAALQNPALAGAAGQFASTAGSVAGSSVTTVASAASNIVSTVASSSLPSAGGGAQGASSAPIRGESPLGASASTRAVSSSSSGGAAGGGGGLRGGIGGSGTGSGGLGGPVAGSSGSAGGLGGERGAGWPGTGTALGAQADGAAAARGGHGGAPMGGSQAAGSDDDEHETPGYLKQFEHFADGRTVAPSVIGADPSWNDR
ncbi:PPE domain-containing protein [Rhodococcus sp. P1Y]|uniref:PPE domain-containing protein n=1 Tax=Rhodococcus sp. P1Y TaxID=1302308 RepID=UPI001913B76C|nr:PPE domain-containing protein [Rhodococcus sp. P1Y]